jgi:enoyl-[acyl-carrier protein] reductase/trans-2-enoyl-CoA reductase (NAD+)
MLQQLDIASGKLCTITAKGQTQKKPPDCQSDGWRRLGTTGFSQWSDAGVLSKGCKTVRLILTIGPNLLTPIYRDGTIGGAKKHLEQTSNKLQIFLSKSLAAKHLFY